jgi:hypothetical protein
VQPTLTDAEIKAVECWRRLKCGEVHLVIENGQPVRFRKVVENVPIRGVQKDLPARPQNGRS